ncbi:hypothetical protein Tco_1051508, partial [Tanacetum coccineum]
MTHLACGMARILELKRRYFEDYCSDNQYAISIKEDTAYLCLHSPKTTKKTRSIRRIQRRPIHRIEDIEGTDIAKISRKRSKPDKHGHGNGKRRVCKSRENAIK